MICPVLFTRDLSALKKAGGTLGEWKTLQQYSAAEMERMMKVQDVILKAMAKKITWWEAAEIIGVSDRTMRRWRERLETDGYSGWPTGGRGSRVRGGCHWRRCEEVLRLYRETYYDLNMQHFHEKLAEEHEIQLSYTWVQTGAARSGAGSQAAQARASIATEATATADAGHAAAHRRQQAPLVGR